MRLSAPKNKVLIIGKLPPPIGGVRVHISRLLAHLHEKGYNDYHFCNLEKQSLIGLFFLIAKYRVAHLHTSAPFFQLAVAIYCKAVKTKLIITYHGNLGRFGFLKNLVSYVSIRLAEFPLIQNKNSLIIAKKWNSSSFLLSAFIPPIQCPLPPEHIVKIISDYRGKYKFLFCTNASNVTFDKNGRETYGITDLVRNMSKSTRSALLISDPTGNYKKYLKKRVVKLPENVLFITNANAFWKILEVSDAFIRNTSTDGDSVSIQEAIYCGTTVFASDCVSRPRPCHLFDDVLTIDFEKEMETKNLTPNEQRQSDQNNTVKELMLLYNYLLGDTTKNVDR